MQGARAFFYVCAGLLCLAIAYHFGATSATAQTPSNPVVAIDGGFAMTANGDVYLNSDLPGGTYHYVTNVFGNGGPTSAAQPSWGQLKAKYAPPRGQAMAPRRATR